MIPLGYLEKGKKSEILRVPPYLRPQGILIEEVSPAEDEFIIKNNTQENSFLSTMRADKTRMIAPKTEIVEWQFER